MNYYQNKLTQIKIALGMEVKMAEAVLEDGVTRVEAEAFEPGMKIFVVSEAGEKAPAPEGTHTTQDGTKVTVDAEGTITAVEKPEAEVEIEIEAAEEEVKVEDKSGDVEAIIEEKMKEMMENVMMAVEEVAKEVGIIKEEMAAYKAKMEKMSKTPAGTKLTTFNKEAVTAANSIEARMEAIARMKESLASKKRKFN